MDWRVVVPCVALPLGVVLTARVVTAVHHARVGRRHADALARHTGRCAAAVRHIFLTATPCEPDETAETIVLCSLTPPRATSLTRLRASGLDLMQLVELHHLCRRTPPCVDARTAADVWGCLCVWVHTTLTRYCDAAEVNGDAVVDSAEAIEVMAVGRSLLRAGPSRKCEVRYGIDVALLRRAERVYRAASSPWRAAVLFMFTVKRVGGWPTALLTALLLCAPHRWLVPAPRPHPHDDWSSSCVALTLHALVRRTLRQATSLPSALYLDVLAGLQHGVALALSHRHTFWLRAEAVLALSRLDFVPDPNWRLPARVWQAVQEMADYRVPDLDHRVAATLRWVALLLTHPIEFGAGWAAQTALDYVYLCRQRAAVWVDYVAHLDRPFYSDTMATTRGVRDRAVLHCLGELRCGGYEEVLLEDMTYDNDNNEWFEDTAHRTGVVATVLHAVLDGGAAVLPLVAVAVPYVTNHATTLARDADALQDCHATLARLRDAAREGRPLQVAAHAVLHAHAPCAGDVAARRRRYVAGAESYSLAAARLARLHRAVRADTTCDPLDAPWAVTLEHVSFRFPGTTHDVLRDISLELDPGSFVGVVGRSGSGKTTLLHVLSGFYAPTSGRVRIHGRVVDPRDAAGRRRRRGVASAWQSDTTPRFFAELSVEHNVALGGLPETTATDVAAALTQAQLRHSLDGRANAAPLTSGQYSGGELDRISVARCLVKPIARTGLCLLDECTAALDSATESRVMRAVRARRTTTVLVTHRLAALRDADTIVLLRDGAIVERGSWHDHLRGPPDSYFHTLYNAQRLQT